MNFTVSEFMLTVIAVSLVVFTVQLFRLSGRIFRVAEAVETASRNLTALMPRLERLTDEATEELRELRGLTRRSQAVTADIQAISGQLRQGVAILDLTRRAKAALVGARAGLAVLRRSDRHTNGKGDIA